VPVELKGSGNVQSTIKTFTSAVTDTSNTGTTTIAEAGNSTLAVTTNHTFTEQTVDINKNAGNGNTFGDGFTTVVSPVTGSNTNLKVTGRSIWLGNTDDDDGDTYINFLTNTSGKRWVAGIDVSATAFIIDQTAANVPQATSDFSLAAGGALTLGGALTCTQINTGQGATEVYAMNQDVETGDSVTFDTVITTKMPGFTGSTITVDGGTF